MAEVKKEEKQEEKGHGKSTYFKSPEYLEIQKWRKNFRALAEKDPKVQDPQSDIYKFANEHGYIKKGKDVDREFVSGIILRKRGWIVKPPDYKEVPCPCKPSVSTGNSAFDLFLITTILILLWGFYCLFFWATLEIYKNSSTDFLYFGCVMQAISFFIIGLMVIAGYNSACPGTCGKTEYDLAMEAAEQQKMNEEAKNTDHRI